MPERPSEFGENMPVRRAVALVIIGMLAISGLQAREEIIDELQAAWRGFSLLEDE